MVRGSSFVSKSAVVSAASVSSGEIFSAALALMDALFLGLHPDKASVMIEIGISQYGFLIWNLLTRASAR